MHTGTYSMYSWHCLSEQSTGTGIIWLPPGTPTVVSLVQFTEMR
jgi:hypothetical protein